MYLKQNILALPTASHALRRPNKMFGSPRIGHPEMRLAFPVPAGVAPIQQQFAGLTLAVAY
jgi:hypothetical protein